MTFIEDFIPDGLVPVKMQRIEMCWRDKVKQRKDSINGQEHMTTT